MALRTYKIVIHLDIHIHLSYILIAEFGCFQINENEATQMVIIEYQIDVIIFLFRMNMLLSVNKGKTLTQLHQERYHVVDDGLLQVAFCIFSVVFKPKKLCHNRVLLISQIVLQRCCEGLHFIMHYLLIL